MKKRSKPIKKLSSADKYYIELLNAEHNYRAVTSTCQCNTPFVVPLLFRIHGTLRSIFYLLSGCLVSIITVLLCISAKL